MNQVLHTQTISWYETSKPPTGIAALLQQFWLVQPSHDPMFKKKTVSWPTICSSVWSTQFLHFWHQPVSPSCTISISTLTFRVVQDAPPLQLSYVPILPSPSVAQPHTAFDVPVPLGEDWNNKNIQRVWADTIDGSKFWRSPVDMVNIPLITGFSTSEVVVWDFFHPPVATKLGCLTLWENSPPPSVDPHHDDTPGVNRFKRFSFVTFSEFPGQPGLSGVDQTAWLDSGLIHGIRMLIPFHFYGRLILKHQPQNLHWKIRCQLKKNKYK